MKRMFEFMWNEMVLDVRERLRYKVSLVSDLLVFTLVYLSVFYISRAEGTEAYVSSQNFMVLIGYIFWQMNALALGYSSSAISREAMRGTLEMHIQSIYPFPFLMGIKLIISLGISLVTFSGILIVALIEGMLSHSNLLFLGETIFLAMPSVIGMYGIGLIIGGISLKEKNIGQMVMVFQTVMLLVSNVVGNVKADFVYLLPFPVGIKITRALYQGAPLNIGEAATYIGVNLVWLLIGVLFFNRMLERERRQGSFDNY